MGPLARRKAYDRHRVLDAAARARARKKRGSAIELYRWVLAVEPHNTEIHSKLAPLLAETGQHFDAWNSFKSVARACLRDNQVDKALAVYKEAVLYLPREVQAWQAVARLQAKRGRSREAVDTLLDGSRRFRTRWLRPQAIHLLRRARSIDAWNFEVVLDLARLLAMHDQKNEARLLLDGLVERSGGERLRRVRAAQLTISPGPTNLWSWLRAALDRSSEPEPEPQPQPDPRPALEAASRPSTSSSVVPLSAARRK